MLFKTNGAVKTTGFSVFLSWNALSHLIVTVGNTRFSKLIDKFSKFNDDRNAHGNVF